jgi:hypothetical protein
MPDVSPRTPSPDAPATSPAGPPGYRERLLPGIGTWVVAIVFGAMLGIIIFPLSPTVSVIIAVVGALAAAVIIALTSPVVAVDAGIFHLGRARIPVRLLGEPVVLEGEEWTAAMSTGFEPLAFHCTRGWIHSGVRVPVLDESDPVPAWVASTRRPQDLALALRAAQQENRAG